jgi:hypothetical protein
MLPDQMRRKSKKLRRNKAERARTAVREKPDAGKRDAIDTGGSADTLAVPQPPRAMPGSDLQLARRLLDGFVEEGRQGRRRTRYLNKGSAMELEARIAIARLLRRKQAPLDNEVREHLANLFDPAAAWQQRKIEFVSRRQGRHTDHVRNTQIASHIWGEVKAGGRVTAAVASAAKQLAISDDMAMKIWGRYRPLMEQIYGSLRGGRAKS